MDFQHSRNTLALGARDGEDECQQAWRSVLDQLQTQMPRASFERWVRDTRAVSLADGVLTIAARSASAREWLENRLATTVERMLVGILNAEVSVVFAAGEDKDQTLAMAGEQNADQELDTRNRKMSASDPEEVLEISPEAFDSAYEQIVRPDRAVYLPGYFRRWLRSIGADMGWMYVSFRQAAYLAGARKGSASHRFTGKSLAAMAGISERTYWRRINDPTTWEKLKGLVKLSDDGPEWDETSPTPKRLPRCYTVAMTLPLTPVDTSSLSRWITLNMGPCGGPEGVLRAAVETPIEQLIPPEAAEAGEPLTVRRLVHQLFGGREVWLKSEPLSNELLDSLASAIQTHLMPQNDLIVITIFFLEHILAHLGSGPGWMLTLLRDLCYVDPEKGEVRDRATVAGGYDEIAKWLGMTGARRGRTIWDWLNEKHPARQRDGGKYKYPITQVYLRELEGDKGLGFETSPRSFDVLLQEIPGELLEASLTARPIDASVRIGLTRMSPSNDAPVSNAVTRLAEDIDATVRVSLNSLTLKENSLKLPITNPLNHDSTATLSDESQTNSAAVDRSALPPAWDLEWFFRHNQTSRKMKTRLREVGATGGALVSWMLYATSTDPKSGRLEDPYAFALSQVVEYPGRGPSENFDSLAALPPRVLAGMLSGADFDHPQAWLFQRLMVDPADRGWEVVPRYRSLLPILLGEKATAPTRNAQPIPMRRRVRYRGGS